MHVPRRLAVWPSVCLCMSVCLSVCLSACLPACPLACLSVRVCVCLSSACLSSCLCLSVCLSVRPSVCLSVCLPVAACVPARLDPNFVQALIWVHRSTAKSGANRSLCACCTTSSPRLRTWKCWTRPNLRKGLDQYRKITCISYYYIYK